MPSAVPARDRKSAIPAALKVSAPGAIVLLVRRFW
jgi:hypothetical protein